MHPHLLLLDPYLLSASTQGAFQQVPARLATDDQDAERRDQDPAQRDGDTVLAQRCHLHEPISQGLPSQLNEFIHSSSEWQVSQTGLVYYKLKSS